MDVVIYFDRKSCQSWHFSVPSIHQELHPESSQLGENLRGVSQLLK